MDARLFVAYSRSDAATVIRIVEDLEKYSSIARIWFGERDIRPTVNVPDQIREAIENATRALFCASPATLPESEGRILTAERRQIANRIRSDSEFKVVTVVLREPYVVPKDFGEHDVLDLTERQNWDQNIGSVANLIS